MEGGPRIGSYVVREVLGQGGMGTVYLAEHAVIGKKVAIKVLKRDLAGHDTLVARFINEARRTPWWATRELSTCSTWGPCPAACLIWSWSTCRARAWPSGSPERKLKAEEATQIAWETASALGAAHAKSIVHRDLKPENLFLARDPAIPEVERVKVLDFGIAKLHADPNQVHTQTGAVMGTPVYMSPEQCRGARDEVDQRTDIYSLGIILYEMLCGKPPFQGEAFGELLLRHMTEPVVPPTSLNPAIPPFLEQTVMRALAKRREERFNSMREFQVGLAGGSGKSADKTPAPLDPRKPAALAQPASLGTLTPPLSAITPLHEQSFSLKSRRTAWVLALAFGGALALGGVIALVSSRRAPVSAPNRPTVTSTPTLEPLPSAPPAPDAAVSAAPPRPHDSTTTAAGTTAAGSAGKSALEIGWHLRREESPETRQDRGTTVVMALHRQTAWISLAVALCAGQSGRGKAQAATPREQAELEARKACAAGRVGEGIEMLAALLTEYGHANYIYNQARCYQQNGKLEQAISRFKEYGRRPGGVARRAGPGGGFHSRARGRASGSGATPRATRASRHGAQPGSRAGPGCPAGSSFARAGGTAHDR